MPTPALPAKRRPVTERRGFLALAAGAAVSLAAAGLPGKAFALAVPGPDDVTTPPASYPALFQSREIALGSPLHFLPKVQSLVGALAEAYAGGDGAVGRWNALVNGLSGAGPMTQIEEINRFVNEVRYIDDQRHWGVDDRWATPAEFFADGGDCEDFALAKFVSLHRLGFNVERLRMVLAQDERRGADHAFLVVYLGDEAHVLDNQIRTVTPHQAISHYRPLCSFNDHQLWLHRTKQT